MKRTIFLLGLILLLSTISIGIAEDFKVEVSANASSFELGESITWTLTPTGGTPDYTIRVYGVMLDLGESSSTMIYTNANPDTYQYNVVSTSGEPVIFKYTPTQINGIMYISWDAWDSNNMYDGGYSEKVTVTGNILPVTATFVPDKTNPQIGEDFNWTIYIEGGIPPYEVSWVNYTLFHNSYTAAHSFTANENEPFNVKMSANINGPLECSIGVKDQSGVEWRFSDTDSVRIVDVKGHTHEISEEILEYGYRYDYGYDENKHWMTCKTCGETFNHEAHHFVPLYYNNLEYCMTCNYEKPAAVKGDSNGDGVTDGRDLLRLAKYLAGQGVTIDEKAADITGDGVVDGRDVLRLAKQLAGS